MSNIKTIKDVHNNPNTRTTTIQDADDVFVKRNNNIDYYVLYLNIVNDRTITFNANVPVVDNENNIVKYTKLQALNQKPQSIFNEDMSLKTNPFSANVITISDVVQKLLNLYNNPNYQLACKLSNGSQRISFPNLTTPKTISIFQRISVYTSYMNIMTKQDCFLMYIQNNNLIFKAGNTSITLELNHLFLNRNMLYTIHNDNNTIRIYANGRQLYKNLSLTLNNNNKPIEVNGNDYGLKSIYCLYIFSTIIELKRLYNNGLVLFCNFDIPSCTSAYTPLKLLNGFWYNTNSEYATVYNNPKLYLLKRLPDSGSTLVVVKDVTTNNTNIEVPRGWFILNTYFSSNASGNALYLKDKNNIRLSANISTTTGNFILSKPIISKTDNLNLYINGTISNLNLIVTMKRRG